MMPPRTGESMHPLFRRLDPFIPIIALLTLLIGYVDLIRGGITLSAIALTLAYCLFIPAWLWRSRASDAAEGPPPSFAHLPSYGAAAIAALAVLLLYLITLSPSTAMWDASEYIASAYVFGVPHPPGNPFFVVVGRVFSLLPLPISVAARINLFAALSSAVAAGMWFLVTERIIAPWLSERWQRIVGASLATLIGATAFTVWTQSVVNEKVYTFALTGIAIVSWLAIRWVDNPRSRKADRLLILIAYICGLGFTNHMAGMLAVPAVGLAVLLRDPRALLRWRLVATSIGAMAIGLSAFITQPIRAAHEPPINEGGVTACRDGFAFSCTFSADTYEVFMYNLNRGQYAKPPVTERQAPLGAQLQMWWQYFSWQWMRDYKGTAYPLQLALAVAMFSLGIFGAWVHWKQDQRTFHYFGPLMAIMTIGLIFYLNFKYGYSQMPELGNTVPREVRERDYFYLWSFSAWGIWAAVGLMFIWKSLAARIAGGAKEVSAALAGFLPPRHWLLTSPVILVAFLPLMLNAKSATRHDDVVTEHWARDLLNTVEPYGVLIVGGDNDTFPLWYAQEVEGVRKDVVVVNTSLLQTDWYTRQLINRPVFEYDAERGPAIFREREWPRPATSPLRITVEVADSVPAYFPMQQALVFEAGAIKATIDPANLDMGVVKRDDFFILQMIKDSWPERGFYFSRSTGNYPAQIGLADYTVRQGLATRLFNPDSTGSPSGEVIQAAGLGWLDLGRSEALWRDVYTAPDALLKLGRWVDEPSSSIPLTYVVTAVELGQMYAARGDRQRADEMFVEAILLAGASGAEDVIPQIQGMRTR